jgi:beta-glucanase (GH16 family)
MKKNLINISNWIKSTYFRTKDHIFDFFLNLYNWILYNIFNIKNGKFNTTNLIPTHFNDFTKMTLSDFKNEYNLSQQWGNYHPGDLNQWYDPSAVILNDNGLNLNITQNTIDVTSYNVDGQTKDNQPVVTIPHGVGLVVSKQAYKYGIYEWNIILPIGAQLWPAIWISCRDSWPPEIDILEGYSEDNSKYGKSINSNIHCGTTSQTHYAVGGFNHHGLFTDQKNLNLILDWTKDYIKIYYNGFLCRIVKDPDDLKWFNDVNMLIIMNTALRTNVKSSVNVTPLIVENFKYFAC